MKRQKKVANRQDTNNQQATTKAVRRPIQFQTPMNALKQHHAPKQSTLAIIPHSVGEVEVFLLFSRVSTQHLNVTSRLEHNTMSGCELKSKVI